MALRYFFIIFDNYDVKAPVGLRWSKFCIGDFALLIAYSVLLTIYFGGLTINFARLEWILFYLMNQSRQKNNVFSGKMVLSLVNARLFKFMDDCMLMFNASAISLYDSCRT